MMNSKPLFLYLFSFASLILSLGIASCGMPGQLAGSPSPTSTAMPLLKAEPFSGAASLARCQAVSQPRYFFYLPSEMGEAEPYLTITGTIYTSDLTPLSDAIVEISLPEQGESSYPPPTRLFLPTDEAGRYHFTTIKPTRPEQPYLRLQFVYQDHCPLLLYLSLVRESRPNSAKQSAFAKVVEVTGPVLQGPLDIVMPVPPPKP